MGLRAQEEQALRTGAEYRESLRDGRNVWVFGEGPIDDVTTHPATRAMVDEYALWYDRHHDPAWQDVLLTPPEAGAERRPVAFEVPQSAADLRRLGQAVRRVHMVTAGNMTHTPGYGALIALGVLDAVTRLQRGETEISNARAYRDNLARTGRFLTFSSGAAPFGFRWREDEKERASLRRVKERDGGVVLSGKVSMHTTTPFAEDVLITGGTQLDPDSDRRSWFIVPVNSSGLRVVTRRVANRHANRFLSPMSSRFDELDAQIWLEEVFVPWERVFTGESPFGVQNEDSSLGTARARAASSIAAWLFWHQHYGWLAKAEFSLGLALALAQVMGLKENPATIEQLTDMIIDVQTARSCVTASELDPEYSAGGYLMPGQLHVASASIYTLRARQRVAEILRGLPGSSIVIAPADTDFDDEFMARELEEAFGGGGYSAKQRAALLQLAWDHVASSLDGREATYEMHANGGLGAWRLRMRALFDSYNELANAVLDNVDLDIPPVDVTSLRNIPMGARVPRQPVQAPKPGEAATRP
jgi:4-hydroxyphenylacetate 3-monooxygenase